MAYRIAGIDVHKKMLAVVVADVEGEGEYQFERRQFGTTPDHMRLLSEWFVAQEVEEVVMESTAQYWKPVWGTLERYWKPTCQKRDGAAATAKCGAFSINAPTLRSGRKRPSGTWLKALNRKVRQGLR